MPKKWHLDGREETAHPARAHRGKRKEIQGIRESKKLQKQVQSQMKSKRRGGEQKGSRQKTSSSSSAAAAEQQAPLFLPSRDRPGPPPSLPPSEPLKPKTPHATPARDAPPPQSKAAKEDTASFPSRFLRPIRPHTQCTRRRLRWLAGCLAGWLVGSPATRATQNTAARFSKNAR